jgi:hypothetical protein
MATENQFGDTMVLGEMVLAENQDGARNDQNL